MTDKFGSKICRAVERYRGRIEPRSGDCGNVASALLEFFDNAELVSVSTSPQTHESAHFCVRINGDLYDGYGRTTAEEMVDEFGESGDSTNPERYLYSVPSVRSENYLIHESVRDSIVENLEDEFE